MSVNLLDPAIYTIAWIAPLPIEARAALLMFEKEHDGRFPVGPGDDYIYRAGEIFGHNVVIATFPGGQEYGKSTAAAIASQIKKFFPRLELGLLVGVAAGLPNLDRDSPLEILDIRLGDVLVGLAEGETAGLVDYELGKETDDGFQPLRGGHVLAQTAPIIRSAISTIRLNEPDEAELFLPYYNACRGKKYSRGSFDDPGQENDEFYQIDDEGNESLVHREPRPDSGRTRVWYGPIGSGDKLMKNARMRNELRDKYNIIGLEMEAAGIINRIPVGVIRGVCDYGDKRKNKQWQPYAAAMAAAYAKAILAQMPPKRTAQVNGQQVMNGVASEMPNRSKHLLDDTFSPSIKRRAKSPRLENSNLQEPPTPPNRVSPIQQNPCNEKQRQAILDSLSFCDTMSRFESIKEAYGETCEWLSTSPKYLEWLEPSKFHQHHGFLWIKGHPGAGKSTIMKFALENIQESTPESTCISFFFHARGTDLQKSTNGMYRSLLWQLLIKVPQLQSILSSLKWKAYKESIPPWKIPVLKSLFKQAVRNLEQSEVICFIDALDECDDAQIQDMISLFEELGNMAACNDISFRVCLSSRYYPNILLSTCLNLELGKQAGHSKDIINYINGNLRIENVDLAQEIREGLIKKASGVFMWVVLVVEILQRQYNDGHAEQLLQRLKDIPENLHDLFRNILTRDDRHKTELLLCIQWVLFAREPLRKDELYLAIRTGVDANTISNWNPKAVSDSDMRRFILSSSKGLVEINKSVTNPTAQFIHESVRECFLRGNFTEIWPEVRVNFRGKSHERLKQCCLDYIKISTPYLADEDDLTHSTQAKPNRISNQEKFPFFKYTFQNILYHAEEAAATHISQTHFLQNFDLAGQIKINLKFQQISTYHYLQTTSLLYELAERNAGNLISYYNNRLYGFKEEDETYCMPILAAIVLNNRRAVYALLKAQADTQPSTSPLHTLCEQYAQVKQMRDSNACSFKFEAYNSLLSNFFHAGDDMVVTFLLAAPATLIRNVKRGVKQRTELLCLAARTGREALVQHLLKIGVNVNKAVEYNQTALWHAVVGNHKSIVQILLANDADIGVADSLDGMTPLHIAVERGYQSMVQLLLDSGASVDARCKKNDTPLHYAVQQGRYAILKLLLSKDADVEAIGGSGLTPLSIAIKEEYTATIQLLIDNGANIEVTYSSGRTPLTKAVKNCIRYGCWWETTLVQLLLDSGANIEAADNKGNTPMSLVKSLPDDDPIKHMIISKAKDKERSYI